MPNKRHYNTSKRYSYLNKNKTSNTSDNTPKIISMPEKIPLPNETEYPKNITKTDDRGIFGIPFPSNILKQFDIKNFRTDDIILIGLIILLFQEGVADEFLIVILFYLFFTEILL